MAIEYKQILDAPDYWIGNNGTILSRRVEGKELEIKQHLNPKTGYMQVALCINEKKKNGLYGRRTFYPHRLVCEYFVDNPNNENTVNHKDLNKVNNHSFNLEWTTQGENIRHYYNSNVKGKPREMKSVEQWSLSGDYIATFPSVNNASISTGVNVASVYHCCKGRTKKPKHFFFKYADDE
jgi:hypothetical protein